MFTKHEERNNDPLPDSFATEEEAGEFRDTHSTMEYQEHLEATDDTIGNGERVFAVQVAQDVFKKLQQEAASVRQPPRKIVDKILRKQLIDSYRDAASPGTSSVPIWLLIAMFPVAILLFWLPEKVFPNWPILVAILTHTADALIVAAIIGLTYEYFVHKHRERAL